MEKAYTLKSASNGGGIALYGNNILEAIERHRRALLSNAMCGGYSASGYKPNALRLNWCEHQARITITTTNNDTTYTAWIEAKRHEVPEAHYDFDSQSWVIDQPAPQPAMTPGEFSAALKASGKTELKVGNVVYSGYALQDFQTGCRDVDDAMAVALWA